MNRDDIEFIKDALNEAIGWAEYAGEYFQQKHNLNTDKENVLKSIEMLNEFEVELHKLKKDKANQLALTYMQGGEVMKKEFENRTCENCKHYDGSHECLFDNSVASGTRNRVYPEDGCLKDWEINNETNTK